MALLPRLKPWAEPTANEVNYQLILFAGQIHNPEQIDFLHTILFVVNPSCFS